ncbi:MAG TPA: DUF2089 domain-containing protein [Dehalococcoidia bacterium]|nr:DUF2089 domain-containing protein [Dehalococcoidia bacterium]
MQNMFDKCPACGGQLIITECRCSQCQMQMRGEFWPGRYLNLSDDQLTFIQVFLSARGNLSEVERILGVSYPTIRNKLDEINEILAHKGEDTGQVQPEDNGTPAVHPMSAEESRKQILQEVAEGKLSPSAAAEKLSKAPSKGE